MTARQRLIIAAAFALLMAATRSSHFGTSLLLPDASLAVFLLGGVWLGGWAWFAGLCGLAFGLDVVAAKTATEAGWCMTPAYAGLLPTYGVMWLAGRYLARTPELPALRFAAVGLAAVVAAFLISNITFWVFSGMFADMSGMAYFSTIAKYFPGYLGSAALYLGLIWAGKRLVQRFAGAKPVVA